MKLNNYNMQFNEMVENIFKDNGWYQGENFSDGTYLKIEDWIIKIYSFSDSYFGEKYIRDFYIGAGVINQKYRKVYTQPEIMRKV